MTDGGSIVDLTQTWASPNTITGDTSNYTDPAAATPKPDAHDDGHGGYVDSRGNKVDKDGKPVDANGKPTDPPLPVNSGIRVDLASLKAAEQTILNETKNQIADFEAFRDGLVSQESWVFFTSNASDIVPYHHDSKGIYGKDGNTFHQDAGDYADVKDPSPETTAKIVQGQNQLLQAVGSCIHLVGTLVGKLNDAGQMYAAADRASWAPTDS